MRRRWVLVLLAAAFLAAVVLHFADVREFWQTVRSGRWEWVAAALVLQAVYYFFYTGIYQAARSRQQPIRKCCDARR